MKIIETLSALTNFSSRSDGSVASAFDDDVVIEIKFGPVYVKPFELAE